MQLAPLVAGARVGEQGIQVLHNEAPGVAGRAVDHEVKLPHVGVHGLLHTPEGPPRLPLLHCGLRVQLLLAEHGAEPSHAVLELGAGHVSHPLPGELLDLPERGVVALGRAAAGRRILQFQLGAVPLVDDRHDALEPEDLHAIREPLGVALLLGAQPARVPVAWTDLGDLGEHGRHGRRHVGGQLWNGVGGRARWKKVAGNATRPFRSQMA
mmetsp:Transcript_111372/g.315282  ORF Transcript_111372/g.315282 Transcript_111372/m.315282 type:complete len:211 (-) Transcript_111372:3-635(-)